MDLLGELLSFNPEAERVPAAVGDILWPLWLADGSGGLV